MQSQRRGFLTKAGAGVAAGAGALLAAPAVQAQGANVKWRLASSFPKSLDIMFISSEIISQKLSEITGGRFVIEVYEAGKIAPALGNLEPVTKGEIECAHTAPYYFYAKDPTFAIDCAIPFGMNTRALASWYYEGNGKKLLREFYEGHNIVNFPVGNTGAQMGGWYKKELKTIEDLKGLKMRIGGFGGRILAGLGGVPTQSGAAEIYGNLESGKLDAAEWVGPYDDEKLGFHRIAPFYYYPGWWEGSAQMALFVNKQAYEKLTPEFKAALEVACGYAHIRQIAAYDMNNGLALQRLIGKGTKLRAMPQPIMDAAFRESQRVYGDLVKTNPQWAKMYPDYHKFQRATVAYSRYAENTYDNFVSRLLVR